MAFERLVLVGALDHVLAHRLGTPGSVVAAVRRELAASIDGSLVSVARTYDRQLQHFVYAIVGARPFVVRNEEVIAGLRVIEDCYRLENAA